MRPFRAAHTAPIVMMGHNRVCDVDRERALADYRVILRAEAEIALLHEKVDLMRECELLEPTGLLRETPARPHARESRGKRA